MSGTYLSNGTPGKVYVQNLVFDDNTLMPSSTVGNGNVNINTNEGNNVSMNGIDITHDSVNSAVLMTSTNDSDHIVIRSSGSGNIYLGTVNNVIRTTTLSLIGNKVMSDIVDGLVKLDPNGPNGSVNIYDSLFVRGGNVGIGVGFPDKKLHISGDIKLSGDIYDSNDNLYSVSWNKNGNDLYYNNGNAIIGDDSVPRGKFEIVASNGFGLVISGDAGTTVPQASFTSSTNGLFIKNNNSNSSYYALSIETSNSASVMHVRNDGLIGIGTTTPSYGFEVATSAYMSHSLVVGGTGLVVSCDNESVMLVGSSSSYIGLYPDDVNTRKGYFGYKDGALKFDTESSSRHFVFDSGNVGLKTSTPTYDLTINSGSSDNTLNQSNTHGLGIIGSANMDVLWMGYDSAATVGYINSANAIGNVPLSLQTLGGHVGVGTLNPLGRLDVRKGTSGTSDWEAASFGAENTTDDIVVIGSYNNNAVIAGKNSAMTTDKNLVLAPTGGNVGIGTLNPLYDLDVSGHINFTGSFYRNGIALGLFTFYENSSGDVYLDNAKFGVGNNTPIYELDIVGDINFTGNMYKNGVLISSGGSGLWSLYGTTDIYFTGGNVGIGVVDPEETLDLYGSFQQKDTIMNFVRTMIPKSGTPQEGTHKGYIILGKAATVAGVNMPASYVIGKVIMRRGDTNEGNNIDVYDIVSSRGYDNEVFTVNFKHDGTGTSGSLFSRLVKCTYDTIEYHAIETEAAGGEPTHEQTFEGYAVDAALVFVDATYVSNVSEFGTLGYSSEISGKFGIGTFAPNSKLTVVSGSSDNQASETAYHGLAIITGLNDETMYMGYDRNADVGYINCAKNGSTVPLCLQTLGGRIGVGTTSPQTAMHLSNGGLLIGGNNTDVSEQGLHLQWNRSGGFGEAWMINNIGASTNVALRNIRFGFTNSGGVVSQKMTLLENGNLGIGNSASPLSGSNLLGLHIHQGSHSSIILGDPIGSGYGGFVQTSDNKQRVFIGANVYDDPSNSWTVVNNTKSYAGISVLEDTNGTLGSCVEFYASDTSTFSGDYVRMHINGDGNVGIGTRYPSDKLQITGSGGTLTLEGTGSGSHCYLQYYADGRGNSRNGWIGYGSDGNIDLYITNENTGGDILMLTPSNVGIGTSFPSSKLTINSGSTSNANGEGAYHGFAVTTGTNDQTIWMGYDGSADIGYINAAKNGSTVPICLQTRGSYVGIGTSDPKSVLHINGEYFGTDVLASSSNKYVSAFNGITTWGYTSGGTQTLQSSSLYATHNMICSRYIVCHGTSNFSDRRIKKDIVDIDDSSALDTIRLIKPKKYSYIDILEKGTTPVWGFIAQEVAETLDYAVDTMEKAIPNIYSLCDVLEQGYVLQFSNFDTANLARKEDNTLITRLQLRTWKNLEIEVEIKNVMSSSKIRLTSPINFEECNAVLENDDVLENKILAYGQIVDDFLTIKKEAIFTVSVAALQEVDRRQVSDNKRIIELESEVSELQEDLIVTRGELTSVQDELYMAKAQIEDMRLRFEDIMSRLSTLETA